MSRPRPQSKEIDVTCIVPSKSNPRTEFEEQRIQELAESMKSSVGLINPITLRPQGEGQYAIVAGERRWRAAMILGWSTISSIVRQVTDEEALEIQIIENSQREDISPMDEARAFKTLLKKENLDWLSSKIHKTKKYILDRLKLNDLCTEAAYLLQMEKLPLGHGIVLSKLPAEEQLQTLDYLMQNWVPWEPKDIDHAHCEYTLEKLKDYIEEKFMLSFDKACFDLKDTALNASAGSCAVCPKRTTNALLLFSDITSEDRCTDNKCFAIKVMNHVNNSLAAAKKKYEKVHAGELGISISSNQVKANGLELYFVDKFKSGLTAVVVTKADSHRRKSLGNLIFVEMPDPNEVKKEKALKRNSGSNQISYQERRDKEIREVIFPRLQSIGKFINSKKLNTKEFPDLTRTFFMDKIATNENYFNMLAGVLGHQPKIKNAEDAIKLSSAYFEHKEFNEIREQLMQEIPEELLPILCLLMETCDQEEDYEKDSESILPTWVELIEKLKIK